MSSVWGSSLRWLTSAWHFSQCSNGSGGKHGLQILRVEYVEPCWSDWGMVSCCPRHLHPPQAFGGGLMLGAFQMGYRGRRRTVMQLDGAWLGAIQELQYWRPRNQYWSKCWFNREAVGAVAPCSARLSTQTDSPRKSISAGSHPIDSEPIRDLNTILVAHSLVQPSPLPELGASLWRP